MPSREIAFFLPEDRTDRKPAWVEPGNRTQPAIHFEFIRAACNDASSAFTRPLARSTSAIPAISRHTPSRSRARTSH